MSEVTLEFVELFGEWMLCTGLYETSREWWFRRRIDAITFAARKGIRLVTE